MTRITLLCLFILSVFSASVRGGELDEYLQSRGLVDVHKLDRMIRGELKYATSDNFLQEKVYDGITGIWLHPDAAEKLVLAQQYLFQLHPGYALIIYDAARPMSVQRKMWDLVRGTNKTNYVSNPANGGGLHNYGMAVDLSIVDEQGIPLDMGTPFDYFGMEAHINKEEELVRAGKITPQAQENRLLLRGIMKKAGFRTILYEWWHFNACSREEAKRDYLLIP